MDGFTVSEVTGLRSPVVVVAFTGWSDTGTVTADAARRLIDAHSGEPFLTVDPEDYYVFTDTRPTVRVGPDGLRDLRWPANEGYVARLRGAPQDLVIVTGVEPNLRWRTFASRLADALAELSPSLVCTLVARPAATPHTRPIPVTGSSADPGLVARYGLVRSTYQGPTGIIGVIHDALRKHSVPLISLSAAVPHYLNVDENPPATIALLRALERYIGVATPLGDLEAEGTRFAERVDEASRGDDQIGAYVRTLEEHYGETGEIEPVEGEQAELPSTDDILRDIEDFLRGSSDS